jgi:hypothetical protein
VSTSEERSPDPAAPDASGLRRAPGALGRFLADLVVGSTPELTLGVLVVLGAALALWATGHSGAVLAVALPVLVSCVLVVSVRRAWVRRSPG